MRTATVNEVWKKLYVSNKSGYILIFNIEAFVPIIFQVIKVGFNVGL